MEKKPFSLKFGIFQNLLSKYVFFLISWHQIFLESQVRVWKVLGSAWPEMHIGFGSPKISRALRSGELSTIETLNINMGLTSDALLNRIAALELHVGIGEHWPKSAKPPLAEDRSLVSRLANLQAKVDRIFIENPELHGLQEIIQTYREDPDNYHPSVLNTTESHQNTGTVINEPRDPEDSVQVRDGFSLDETTMVNAEKQELILISYPTIIECYNLLSQFHLMDIPTLSTELTEKLSLTRLNSERLTCQTIAWQFHLLVVKSIIVIEEFAAMIKHQTLISQSIAKRMQILASKISSLERKRQLENKY